MNKDDFLLLEEIFKFLQENDYSRLIKILNSIQKDEKEFLERLYSYIS